MITEKTKELLITEKIKELCFLKGITINQLADKIGMSASFYTTLKKGSWKVETLEKVADALGVPMRVFFEENSETWPEPKLIKEIEVLGKENDELLERIRARRSLLRLISESLNLILKKVPSGSKTIEVSRSTVINIVRSIEDLEHFESEKEWLEVRQMERKKK